MLARRGCFFLGFFLGDAHEHGGERRREERVGRRREKALRGKQLLKRSNTGEGDTLTSCMRCHGYQSPACHPFLAFPPLSFFPLDILALERRRKDTKGGERRRR